MSENSAERTEKINDGGQAFPQPLTFDAGGIAIAAYPGMSLRDWFAGRALNGMLSTELGGEADKSDVAEQAYFYADAMIEARSK